MEIGERSGHGERLEGKREKREGNREKRMDRERLIGIPSIVSGIVSIGQIEAIHFPSLSIRRSRKCAATISWIEPAANYDFISPITNESTSITSSPRCRFALDSSLLVLIYAPGRILLVRNYRRMKEATNAWKPRLHSLFLLFWFLISSSTAFCYLLGNVNYTYFK
mgnify:CR=1 FL=1